MVFWGVIFCALLIAGCKKTCHKCVAWEESSFCYKGNDTIEFYFTSRKAATDSANYYQSYGYVCHVIDNNYIPIPSSIDPPANICNKQEYEYYLAGVGDSCWLINN